MKRRHDPSQLSFLDSLVVPAPPVRCYPPHSADRWERCCDCCASRVLCPSCGRRFLGRGFALYHGLGPTDVDGYHSYVLGDFGTAVVCPTCGGYPEGRVIFSKASAAAAGVAICKPTEPGPGVISCSSMLMGGEVPALAWRPRCEAVPDGADPFDLLYATYWKTAYGSASAQWAWIWTPEVLPTGPWKWFSVDKSATPKRRKKAA